MTFSDFASTNISPDEYSKTTKQNNNQKNLFTLISALISFNLRVVSDTFTLVADWTKPRYEESKKTASDYIAAAQDKAGDAQKYAQGKLDEAMQNGEGYSKVVQDKLNEAKQNGEGYTKAAQETAQEKGEQAKEKGEQTKEQVEKSAKKSK